jgi:hypothetical protein|tara:strand:- start:150 stop:494 length:345 start_codon:yes stop_codon:yes gene_type:complete
MKEYKFKMKSNCDVENMTELEKLIFSIKQDSMKKVVFMKNLILNPEESSNIEDWTEEEHKFLEELVTCLMFRIDLGIEQVAKMFMEDYLRDGGVAENLFPAKEGKGSSTPQIKP